MSNKNKYISSGHKVEYLDEENCKRIHMNFPIIERSFRLHPGNWFFEEHALETIERVQDFEFKSTDVIAATYPKSGTTWSQEILWTFLHNPNLDNPLAEKVLDMRSPHLEADLYLAPPKVPRLDNNGEIVKYIKSICPDVKYNEMVLTFTKLSANPRVIKTHLPLSLLPKTALKKSKIVYISRDPRDVIISRFNFVKLVKFQNFLGTFDEYLDCFINDEVYFNPYWNHLMEAWSQRNHPNLLFLKYEDLIQNPLQEYEKINQFVGANLPSEEVQKIIEYTSFQSMKKRSEGEGKHQPMSDGGRLFNQDVQMKTGGFFRKGKVGDWTENFTDAQIMKIKTWVKKSTKGFPEDFPYLDV